MQSYVVPNAKELLALVNNELSPFSEVFTMKDLDIMSVNADGSVSSSTGYVEDQKAALPPPKDEPEEELPEEAENGNPLDPETGEPITAVDPETGEPLVPPDTVPGSNGSGGEPAAPNGGTAQPGGTVPSNPPDNAQPSTPETSSPTTPEAPDPNAPSAPAEPAPVPEVPEAPQIPEDPGFALIGPDPAA